MVRIMRMRSQSVLVGQPRSQGPFDPGNEVASGNGFVGGSALNTFTSINTFITWDISI